MPIYEYDCIDCCERFSLLQSITGEKNETKCSKCGSVNVKKRISSFCCSSGSAGSPSSVVPSGGFGGGG